MAPASNNSSAARPTAAHLPRATLLSPREAEVLQLALIEDLSDKEIAERLGTAIRTIDYHVEAVASKLGARGRLKLGWLLHERGLL